MEFKNIYDGWRNLLRDTIKNVETDDIVIKKLNICSDCLLLTKMYTCNSNITEEIEKDFKYNNKLRKKGIAYKGCGCFIPAKVRSKSQCPLGKWEDI